MSVESEDGESKNVERCGKRERGGKGKKVSKVWAMWKAGVDLFDSSEVHSSIGSSLGKIVARSASLEVDCSRGEKGGK